MKTRFEIMFVVLLLFSFCGCRETSQTTWEDVKVQDGLVCLKGTKKHFTGVIVSKYPNGSMKSEARYRDGVRNGPFYCWYENGQKQSEVITDKEVPLKRIDWRRDGSVLFEVLLSGGETRGVFFHYSTGEPWTWTIYSLDQKSARTMEFDRKGHILADGVFDRVGKRKFTGTFCNTDYEVLVVEKYSDGKLVGTTDKNGNLIDAGKLKKNEYSDLEGDAKIEASEKLY